MNPQVGDIVQVSRVWRGTHIVGQVIRIFEKCPPYAEDYYRVRLQGVSAAELWFAKSDITSIISEGQMTHFIITFIIGLEVGVIIGILWEQRERRLFREEYAKKIKEL